MSPPFPDGKYSKVYHVCDKTSSLKGTLKWSEIFSYMKEGGSLTPKIKTKIPTEPSFSFKFDQKS